MPSKLYLVTGMSGSGKTTVARHLLERGEVAFDSKINPGIYHFINEKGIVAENLNLKDEQWKKQYRWLLNKEKLQELLEKHKDAQRVFLCGRANIFQYWDKASKVFLLRVDEPTLLDRLNNESRDNMFAKDAATQERLINNLDTVQEKISQKGAIIIDARASIEKVVDQILLSI